MQNGKSIIFLKSFILEKGYCFIFFPYKLYIHQVASKVENLVIFRGKFSLLRLLGIFRLPFEKFKVQSPKIVVSPFNSSLQVQNEIILKLRIIIFYNIKVFYLLQRTLLSQLSQSFVSHRKSKNERDIYLFIRVVSRWFLTLFQLSKTTPFISLIMWDQIGSA